MADHTFAHIGIAACSAEGAALCYRHIVAEACRKFGQHRHPEVSLYTPSLADYMCCIEHDDWDGVSELLLLSASKLAAAGADFVICPDNTLHRAFDAVSSRSTLPWLNIAQEVARVAAERGFMQLGLTGTQWLVDSDVYPQQLGALGLRYTRPAVEQRQKMNCIIMDELVAGKFKPQSIAYFQSVIGGLKEAGCDAVVLGCTEIPLIINDQNSTLPTLNSTALLASAAVRRALIV